MATIELANISKVYAVTSGYLKTLLDLKLGV